MNLSTDHQLRLPSRAKFLEQEALRIELRSLLLELVDALRGSQHPSLLLDGVRHAQALAELVVPRDEHTCVVLSAFQHELATQPCFDSAVHVPKFAAAAKRL